MMQYKLIAYIVIAAAIFFAGWTVNGWRMHAAQVAAMNKMETQHMKDLQDAAEIIGQEANRAEKTRIVYRTRYKAITAASVGSTCHLTPQWVSNYNEASAAPTETNKLDGGM